MAMTTAEYEAFVAQLSETAHRDPPAYKRKVILLALLGYGYVGVMSLIILLLGVVAIASIVYLKALGVKLAIALFIFLYFVAKAMFVRVSPPTGRPITRREAPALFDTIDRLRRSLGAPRFQEVLVVNDFNAAVTQIPRLGIFGWHRNYLLLGLPLMKSLTVPQFEAVLAHELGHLAGGHAALSNWVYRLRMGWQRLDALLEYNRSWGSFMFRRFFRWYAPYFGGYSFPLARMNEYEADRAAAQITSAQSAAEALTSVNVIGRYLDQKFWPDVHKQADSLPQPAFAPYSKISDKIAVELEAALTKEWLDQSMKQETNSADTHPSLKDRLNALGQESLLAPPPQGQAADRLLGDALPIVTAELDKQWSEAIAPSWEKRFHEVQEGRKRLEELALAKASRELTHEELYEVARLTESFGNGADAALEQLKALCALAPNVPVYKFSLGLRLIARDDAAGISMLEEVMKVDEEAIAPACQALRDYYWRAGDKDNAYSWNDRLGERQQVLDAAEFERNSIRTTDKFLPHELDPAAVENVKKQLAAIPELRRVYLVRKHVEHVKGRPLYLCGFGITGKWRRHKPKEAAAVQRKVLEMIHFPGETLVFSVEGDNSGFEKKFKKLKDVQLM